MVFKKVNQHIPSVARHTYVAILMIFSWVIFANTDMQIIKETYRHMLGLSNIDFISNELMFIIKNYLVLFILAVVSATPVVKRMLKKLPDRIKNCIYIVVFAYCIFVISDTNYSPFIYFRF